MGQAKVSKARSLVADRLDYVEDCLVTENFVDVKGGRNGCPVTYRVCDNGNIFGKEGMGPWVSIM